MAKDVGMAIRESIAGVHLGKSPRGSKSTLKVIWGGGGGGAQSFQGEMNALPMKPCIVLSFLPCLVAFFLDSFPTCFFIVFCNLFLNKFLVS